MAQTIRRKATGVRRQAKAQGRKGQVRKAKAHTNSLLDRIMRSLPFTEEQWHKVFTLLIVAVVLAILIVVARVSGATALAENQIAGVASNAGFEVRHVEVRGVERMNDRKVYERALGVQDRAMTRVDLHELRAELLELPWVKDARVSRQLPDALVIDIVEREPHAALQRADRLMLIDGTGHELEPVSRESAADMLVIKGPGAQDQVEELTALLEAAPALRQHVTGAEWVGNRRWNLTFDTDQQLALPQGKDLAAGALVSFARLDGVNRLLGGEVVAFDMRDPDRIYMRVPGRAERELDARKDS